MDLVLDVSRMAVDENGVRGFVWPISQEEILAVRDTFLPPLVATVRGTSDARDEGAELLRIVMAVFVNETLGVYQAYALCRRLQGLGHSMIPPAESRLLHAMAAGNAPPPSPLLDNLRRGLQRARFRAPANLYRVRTHLQWNGLSSRLLRPFDRDQDIVAIQRIPLIGQHARAVSDFVRFVHPADWFDPLSMHQEDHAAHPVAYARTVEGALAAARIGFAAGNEEAPDYLIEYLRDWLVGAMGLAGRHLSGILRQPERVPRRLWTGSGAGVWSRILRHATRRLGGTVAGHDHGNGEGYLESGSPTLAEFESCDTFVTFTPTRARALAKGMRDDLLAQPEAPSIISVPSEFGESSPFHHSNRRRKRSRARGQSPAIRTVMYPTLYYSGDMVHAMSPLLPDIAQVDWQARLISHLREWGYEVLLKPHPGHTSSAKALGNRLGATTLTERFENVMDKADVLLFDYPRTTTFGTALASNTPVVLVDWQKESFTSDAREKLQRRCRIVPAWFDDQNRLQTDWANLRNGIEESVELTDQAFYESYLVFGKSTGG